MSAHILLSGAPVGNFADCTQMYTTFVEWLEHCYEVVYSEWCKMKRRTCFVRSFRVSRLGLGFMGHRQWMNVSVFHIRDIGKRNVAKKLNIDAPLEERSIMMDDWKLQKEICLELCLCNREVEWDWWSEVVNCHLSDCLSVCGAHAPVNVLLPYHWTDEWKASDTQNKFLTAVPTLRKTRTWATIRLLDGYNREAEFGHLLA
jgi:hypothetical protein